MMTICGFLETALLTRLHSIRTHQAGNPATPDSEILIL